MDVNNHLLQLEELKKNIKLIKEKDIQEDNKKAGYWIFDIKNERMFLSKDIFQILECKPEEYNGTLEDCLSFVHPENIEVIKIFRLESTDIKEDIINFKIISKNGKIKDVQTSIMFLKDENNNPINIVGIFKEVREKNLRDNSENKANLGIWKYDVINDKFYCTDEIFNIYGVGPLEFNNDYRKAINLIHPDYKIKIENAIKKYLLGEKAACVCSVSHYIKNNKFVVGKLETIYDESGYLTTITGVLECETKNNIFDEFKRCLKLINQVQKLSTIGSWQADFDNNRCYLSDEASRIFGFPTKVTCISLDEMKEYIHPDDIEKIYEIYSNPSEDPVEIEFRLINKDGSERHIYEIVEFAFNDEKEVRYMYGTIQDITDKVILKNKLRLEEEKIYKLKRRFSALIKDSFEIFEILDSEGKIVYISEASERVTGYKIEERIGKQIFEFYDKSEIPKLVEMIEFVKNNPEKKITKDILLKTKDGKEIYLEFHMQNYLNDTAIEGIVVNFRDITDRVKNEQKIIYLSSHDHLTGLPNRLSFNKKINELIKEAKENNKRFALFMVDIDSIIFVKNTLGYKIAEQYTVQIVEKLKLYCGNKKLLFRYTAHRFVIVIEGVRNIDEYKLILKILFKLFSQPIKVDKYELDVKISVGISIYENNKIDKDELVRNAEVALFLAKNEERNRYKFYSSDTSIQTYKYFILQRDLRRAVENNQLRIFYQPFVNLNTNEIIGAEALIRWEHPEWGIISPNEFISMAEETGYIINIGNWLLKEVCSNYKEWIDNGLPNIKISINLSRMQLLEADLVKKIKNIIEEYELKPNFLILEIKESALMGKRDKIISSIKELRSLGIQIALDDFGTGYSSLTCLPSRNIDILKLDGSFINKNEDSTIIIKHIIRMAQELKIKISAEKIESWAQLEFLRNLKCYSGQGYLYSKPSPKIIFEKVLAKKKCKPVIVNDTKFEGDRRQYFRVKFMQSLEAELTVLEIKGKKVNVGNTKVLIKNIGPGGLCFVSDINLPIDNDIVLQFTTKLMKTEVKVYGHSVWGKEIDTNLYEYGIKFSLDENKLTELVRLLNQVQISMKKDILFADGSFISGTIFSYFAFEK
ncbi:EAL domain-containing protein [Clostridium isatidis]|uniref:EAL domain-containing protein n=1 Tax=Clostridium isatidis TaxID=182773 RepID=UPI003AAFD429